MSSVFVSEVAVNDSVIVQDKFWFYGISGSGQWNFCHVELL